MAHFQVFEHVIDSTYIREYAYATLRNQEDKLKLHVKQYIPLHQPTSTPSSTPSVTCTAGTATRDNPITILAAGGLGLPKEVYEPLWDELYEQSQSDANRQNFSIGSIWIADPVQFGLSAVLNEGKLGDDPSWIDYARDLFILVNHFRDHMPQPIVGIAHSVGCIHIANLALMHPRLISVAVFLDPFFSRFSVFGKLASSELFRKYVVHRQPAWPSRKSAEEEVAKWPVYKGWDPRCLAALLKYGLRETTPVPQQGSMGSVQSVKDTDGDSNTPVTWTTSNAQELHTISRIVFTQRKERTTALDGRSSYEIDRELCPDLDPLDASGPLYRWEARATWERIVELRPSAKFILAAQTFFPLDEIRESVVRCGTGRSGSGGVAADRVKEVTFEDVGHHFPMQIVRRTAVECAGWLAREVPRWYEQQRLWRDDRDRRLTDGERIGLEMSPLMREILDREKLRPKI